MAQSIGGLGGTPRAGYNQSGGAYWLVISSILPTQALNTQTNGSGSGGAYAPPTLSTLYGPNTNGQWASTITAGKVIRDLGRSVVSSGRAFRKFQAVIAQSASTGGVAGAIPNTGVAGDAGYLTFYLEVPFNGLPSNNIPLIAPAPFYN
jgi:hypothetical protein